MKIKQLFAVCGIAAALFWGLSSASAQNNGGGGFGGGGGGRGNFDPAQFRQRMMDGIRDRLEFTNDTDWNAVQPLVQKVMDARFSMGGNGMGMMFRRNRGGDNGGDNGGGVRVADPLDSKARRPRPCKRRLITMRQTRKSKTCWTGIALRK